MLDHVWYNRFNDYLSGILLLNSTDHEPTFLILKNLHIDSTELIKVTFRLHSEENINNFVSECSHLNLQYPDNDIHSNVAYFNNTINELYCKCFPLKTKYITQKRMNKPWLTSSLFEKIKLKSKFYKMSKLGTMSLLSYKRYRNKLTNDIRNAKRSYYKNAFTRCSNNMKATWNLINGVVHEGKSRENINEIVIDGVSSCDGTQIAEKFNEYFCEVALKLQNDIPNSRRDPMDNMSQEVSNSMFLFPVTSLDIVKIVKNLKNSSYGLFSVPTKIF